MLAANTSLTRDTQQDAISIYYSPIKSTQINFI